MAPGSTAPGPAGAAPIDAQVEARTVGSSAQQARRGASALAAAALATPGAQAAPAASTAARASLDQTKAMDDTVVMVGPGVKRQDPGMSPAGPPSRRDLVLGLGLGLGVGVGVGVGLGGALTAGCGRERAGRDGRAAGPGDAVAGSASPAPDAVGSAAPAPAAASPPAPPPPSAGDAIRGPDDARFPSFTGADGAAITRRPIPSTGELLPAIGLGSWQTFDVGPDEVEGVLPVVAHFLARGGRVIDSSPMYGQAEAAIGRMLAAVRAAEPTAPDAFVATKVWTSGERAGREQMERSMRRLGVSRLDLMQIHNLLDWKVHLKTLRAWKEAGRFRYLGVTHYQHGAFAELEQLVRRERLDFVQLPYSVADRAAEARLLPAAAAAGVAVLVMQPFDSGALFRRVRGKPLPPVAAELGCSSWAQLFLVWLLGHPAVTCPIPATSRVAHLLDNMGALTARVPDAAQRAAIVRAVEA